MSFATSSTALDPDREPTIFSPNSPKKEKNSRFQIFTRDSHSERSGARSKFLSRSGSSIPGTNINFAELAHSPLHRSSSSGSLSARISSREPLSAENTLASPRPLTTPRRFNLPFARKKSGEHSFQEAASLIKPGSTLLEIQFIQNKRKELETILNDSAISPREDHTRAKEADIRAAISDLEDTLNESWKAYLTLLNTTTVCNDQFKAFSSATHTLTNVYGEQVEFTLVKKLKEGGNNYSYIVRETSGRESILLIGKENEKSHHADSLWHKEQIESIVWREKVSKQFEYDNFFPVHYHTFVLNDEHFGLPTRGFLIEKLEPLSQVDNRIEFCEKLIDMLYRLHEKNCAHGDVTPGNIFGDCRLSDLDIYCFVDFTLLERMSPAERDKQFETMRVSGITSLYAPPKFQERLVELIAKKDIRGLRTCLQLKDRYGLALFIWEFCRMKEVSDIEDEDNKTLSEATLEKILSTTRKSKHLSKTLKEWIEEVLTESFDKFTVPKVGSFSSSNSSLPRSPSSGCSSTSLPDTSIPKQAFFDFTD